jgi:hypothetical protein
MANPLSGLTPALEVLAQNVDILPATGQAVEDLCAPVRERSLSILEQVLDIAGSSNPTRPFGFTQGAAPRSAAFVYAP